MSDSLDPGDAFLSALGGAFLGFASVIGVSLGGHFMGLVLHDLSLAFVALPGSGWSAFNGLDFDSSKVISTWFGVFVGSFATWLGWPFLILDIWLLARLRSGAEFFSPLLILAITQPLHSLLVRGSFSSVLGFVIALGLWVVIAFVLAALVLWWRRMSDEAPLSEPEETEPEL